MINGLKIEFIFFLVIFGLLFIILSCICLDLFWFVVIVNWCLLWLVFFIVLIVLWIKLIIICWIWMWFVKMGGSVVFNWVFRWIFLIFSFDLNIFKELCIYVLMLIFVGEGFCFWDRFWMLVIIFFVCVDCLWICWV